MDLFRAFKLSDDVGSSRSYLFLRRVTRFPWSSFGPVSADAVDGESHQRIRGTILSANGVCMSHFVRGFGSEISNGLLWDVRHFFGNFVSDPDENGFITDSLERA